MSRMIMVNTVCSGSHGRLMRDLRDTAAGAGFDTAIAFGRGEAIDGRTLRIGGQADVLLHVALTRTLDRHARGSLRATRRFVAQLRQEKPDLIHLHNVHGYYLHAETLFDYLRAEQVPTVWTLHDCWAFTGHCSHFLRARCDRWQTGCYHCPLKHDYPASYGLDASRENWRWKREAFASLPSLRIVTPSQWLADTLADSFLRDVPRQVIPNGVDLSLFAPMEAGSIRAQYGVKPGQKLLLSVAAPFDERKGLSDVLALADQLGDRVRLVLVGLSPKQIAALPGGVMGLERTAGPEALVQLYNAADCLVNPSHEETYPTVNMEAMACGTPVACYRVGGAPEQLGGSCGTAVPDGDVDALAEAALSLADAKPLHQAECRRHAELHFDRQHALSTYINLYQQMTGV